MIFYSIKLHVFLQLCSGYFASIILFVVVVDLRHQINQGHAVKSWAKVFSYFIYIPVVANVSSEKITHFFLLLFFFFLFFFWLFSLFFSGSCSPSCSCFWCWYVDVGILPSLLLPILFCILILFLILIHVLTKLSSNSLST